MKLVAVEESNEQMAVLAILTWTELIRDMWGGVV